MNYRLLAFHFVVGVGIHSVAVGQTPAATYRYDPYTSTVTINAPQGVAEETYLGTMTAPAARSSAAYVVEKQPTESGWRLRISAATGLVILSVEPDSPASSALKKDDILLRLDDQILVESNQLSALIRSHNEGDEVTLVYLRDGSEQTSKIKLAKRKATPTPQTRWTFVPDRKLANNMVALESNSTDQDQTVVATATRDSVSTMTIVPSGETVMVTTNNGKRKVTVLARDGSVSYAGPFDTEAERAAAPAWVTGTVERAEQRRLEIGAVRSRAGEPVADDWQQELERRRALVGAPTRGVADVTAAGSGMTTWTISRNNEGSKVTSRNSRGTVDITVANGKKSVVVRNPDGTEAFSGPFDTDAERAKVPASIRSRIEELERDISQVPASALPR